MWFTPARWGFDVRTHLAVSTIAATTAAIILTAPLARAQLTDATLSPQALQDMGEGRGRDRPDRGSDARAFGGAWERDAFLSLWRNAIAYTPAA